MKVAERINKYGVGVCSNAELLQAAGGKKENVETMEDLYNIIDSLTPQNQYGNNIYRKPVRFCRASERGF